MHQEVLKLGPELYQKQEEYNLKRFEESRRKHEENVTAVFNREVEEVLGKQRDANTKLFGEKEAELRTMVNKFLSAEAATIRTKRWLRRQSIQRELDTEGQKHLLVSLNKAKDDFDVEKAEAIKTTVRELDSIAYVKEAKKQMEYQKIIGDINSHWMRKFQNLQDDLQKKREENIKKVTSQIHIVEKRLDNEFENILSRRQDKLKLELDFLKRKATVEKERNDILKGNISGLETKMKYVILNEETVTKAFVQFIRSTNGMNEEDARKVVEAYTQCS